MFGNKKNRIVSPRPEMPSPEQIIEDLKNSSSEDVAFTILKNEKSSDDDLHFPTNANDPADVYRKVKTHLDTNERLKNLRESLETNVQLLSKANDDILKLAQEIKAQAALAE